MRNVERDREIYALRLSGATHAAIARDFGLCRGQIAQICYKMERYTNAERRREEVSEHHKVDLDAAAERISSNLQDVINELGQLEDEFKNMVCGHLTPDDLRLTMRCRNCLTNAGIKTIRQLIEHSEAELLRIPNFGKTSLAELRDELARWGIPFPTVPRWASRFPRKA